MWKDNKWGGIEDRGREKGLSDTRHYQFSCFSSVNESFSSSEMKYMNARKI